MRSRSKRASRISAGFSQVQSTYSAYAGRTSGSAEPMRTASSTLVPSPDRASWSQFSKDRIGRLDGYSCSGIRSMGSAYHEPHPTLRAEGRTTHLARNASRLMRRSRQPVHSALPLVQINSFRPSPPTRGTSSLARWPTRGGTYRRRWSPHPNTPMAYHPQQPLGVSKSALTTLTTLTTFESVSLDTASGRIVPLSPTISRPQRGRRY